MEELSENDPSEIGPYELLGILGSGGMGRVYLGQDADGERVAVKVVHSDLAREPEFRRRFQREIEALRAVSGPGIAAILDADAEAQRPWLATEYVDGPSLHHVVIKGSGPLDAGAVRALGAALARTLADIHAAKLVHRDIKPTNLLLADGEPKLIDFGIARDLAASTITRTGLAVGTPQFMAPEQLESGRATGTAADVFALAGLLVFAASGLGPFGEGTPAQLLYAIVHSEPELGAVPAELRPLLLRCLQKDPAKRPTAERVAEELSGPPVAEDPDATVPIGGGADGPDGLDGSGADGPGGSGADGSGDVGRSRRSRRAALVGVAALAVVVATAVMLTDGNAAGSNNAGRSAKSGVFPTGDPGSDSQTTSGAGTSPTNGGSESVPGAPPGTKPPAGSPSAGAVSGSGSAPGAPAGSSGASGAGSGGTTGGATGGPGPGPSTSSQAAGTHGSGAPTKAPTSQAPPSSHTPPPSSHAPSMTPPPGSSAPGAVTGVSAGPASPYITMTVNWSADPGAASYVVKYTESLRPGTPPVTATGTSVTLNVIPQETVCIQVQAVNSDGTSAWSPASPYCVVNWTS
ncbi:protein kinase [Catenulispora sp. NL8]|uniref:Protein kinase n=1 Tax=Catenulispora pinistramenti TaxID=2705254 RepID=A0ABS5L368_9ACTN|nr:protein kinase [Catenulispora pinistramenti]MBS2552599.1 protein kinase [Catenulispora pinistramenti]